MNWEILYKYVQGQCSEKELKKLGVWLREDPANEDFFTSFVEGWEEESEPGFNTDDRAAWNEFKAKHPIPDAGNEFPGDFKKLFPTSTKKIPVKKSHRKKRGVAFWGYSFVSAAVLIVILLFVARQHIFINNAENGEIVQYQEIRTINGQRSNLKLSDGSIVFLNSSTTLKIPQDYGNETRTIYLEGEAFFEVAHEEDNPFIVISDGIYTKVLGTQFNISAYDSGRVEVAVREGLVSMGKMDHGSLQKGIVEITPNKVGILKEVGGLTVYDIENMDKYVGWTDGKLVFQDTPFTEVAERLERWYDIEVDIESVSTDLQERTLTATYDNMPMSEVLQVMAISMNLSYERDGRTFFFRQIESIDTENRM